MPEMDRFMDAMNAKTSTIYDMIDVLENPQNPPPMDRYSLILSLIFVMYTFRLYIFDLFLYRSFNEQNLCWYPPSFFNYIGVINSISTQDGDRAQMHRREA